MKSAQLKTPDEKSSSVQKKIFIGIDGTGATARKETFYSNVYRLNVALNYSNKSGAMPQIFLYFSGPRTGLSAVSNLPRNIAIAAGKLVGSGARPSYSCRTRSRISPRPSQSAATVQKRFCGVGSSQRVPDSA